MSISDLLTNRNGRTEPVVWVRRLMIYKRLDPEPELIREISLRKGLNIIWGKEEEAEDASPDMAGHNVGKTTFCRFLRYVLGEKTFAKKGDTKQLRNTFPQGWIAAELRVDGRDWAVRRPISKDYHSYIMENATVEQLVAKDDSLGQGKACSRDSYPEELGFRRILDSWETGAIVQTREPIQWGHVLAWIARDQEARYQSLHDWRSPRSDSDSPSFRFPKEGPLFVIRAALGLFLPDELRAEEELAEQLREQTRLEKQLEQQEREPRYRVNLYEEELRRRLQELLPDRDDIREMPVRVPGELFTLEGELKRTLSRDLQNQIENSETERQELQEDLDDLGAEIRRLERELHQRNALLGLETSAGNEVDDGLRKRSKVRQLIQKYADATCLGGVPYRDCEKVQALKGVLRPTEIQDVQTMEQAEARRQEAKDKVEQERTQISASMAAFGSEREKLLENRREVELQIRRLHAKRRELETFWEQYQHWESRLASQEAYPELHASRQSLEEASSKVDELRESLERLSRTHADQRTRLESIFAACVNSVLPAGQYTGVVSLEKGNLDFGVMKGDTLGGEAVQTLSVLLADVACMLHSATNETPSLPGIWVHDSPREADLGHRIYEQYLKSLRLIEEAFGRSDNCPFQYIVTTTTPPPPDMEKPPYLRLVLDARQDDGLLLRKRF